MKIILIFALSAFINGTVYANKSANDEYTTIMSTKFDFNETSINGQGAGPKGFFLQGRKKQSLSQMVRLRPDFKDELLKTKKGIKSVQR